MDQFQGRKKIRSAAAPRFKRNLKIFLCSLLVIHQLVSSQGTNPDPLAIPFKKKFSKDSLNPDKIVFCDQGAIFLLNKTKRQLAYALDLADYDKNGPKYIPGSFIDVNCNKETIAAIKLRGRQALVGQTPPQDVEIFDLVRIKKNTDQTSADKYLDGVEGGTTRRGRLSLKVFGNYLFYEALGTENIAEMNTSKSDHFSNPIEYSAYLKPTTGITPILAHSGGKGIYKSYLTYMSPTTDNRIFIGWEKVGNGGFLRRAISTPGNPVASTLTAQISSIPLAEISFIQLDGGGQRMIFVADSNKSAIRWIDSSITSATAGSFLLDVGTDRQVIQILNNSDQNEYLIILSCTINNTDCWIRQYISIFSGSPRMVQRIFPTVDGAEVPLVQIPEINFLNYAPKNDVVYYIYNNELVVLSLSQQTNFQCAKISLLENCLMCTTEGQNLGLKRCELCAFGRNISSNICLPKNEVTNQIPPKPALSTIPLNPDRNKLPMTITLTDSESQYSVYLCDSGSIFFLNTSTNQLSYALSWDDYFSTGTQKIEGEISRICCNGSLIAVQIAGSPITPKGSTQTFKPLMIALLLKKLDPTTKRTIYMVDEIGKRALSGRYGQIWLNAHRNRILATVYKFLSSDDIVNIGLDAQVKRMIVMEIFQDKIVQLFVDDFVLDQQPLKTYVYFNDAETPSMRIITQVSGSTLFREWSERDTSSIKVRSDVYKDYAFKIWWIKTPGNDAIPTKLVILDEMNKLYMTTGAVDKQNPGKLILNLPSNRKIVNIINRYDQNDYITVFHCNSSSPEDCELTVTSEIFTATDGLINMSRTIFPYQGTTLSETTFPAVANLHQQAGSDTVYLNHNGQFHLISLRNLPSYECGTKYRLTDCSICNNMVSAQSPQQCFMCAWNRETSINQCLKKGEKPGQCKDYFTYLKCYKEMRKEPFTYKALFMETGLRSGETPHFQLALNMDNMDLALKNEPQITNFKIERMRVDVDVTSPKRQLADDSELTNICAKDQTTKATYQDGRLKVFLILSKECREKLDERLQNRDRNPINKIVASLGLPNNGVLTYLNMSPSMIEVEMSKSQLAKYLEEEKKKELIPEPKSQLINQLSDIKKLTSVDPKDLAEKTKALDEAQFFTTWLAYLGVCIGGFSLMQVAIMVSFLFKVIKKFIFINTNYGRHMKSMLEILNGNAIKRQEDQYKSTWYNYQNYQTNKLLSPGPYHIFSIYSLLSLYIKIGLIFLFRKLRRLMMVKIDQWKTQHNSQSQIGSEKGAENYTQTGVEKTEQQKKTESKMYTAQLDWKKKLLIKVFQLTYVLEIAVFVSCLMDILFFCGYDLVNYNPKINPLNFMAILNILLCVIGMIYISYELTRFAIKNYALVSEAFAQKNPENETSAAENKGFVIKEFEMTDLGKVKIGSPKKSKKEPSDDFSTKMDVIHVDEELDQDPDLVLAEISDGDISGATDASSSSEEAEGEDALQDDLETETETVLKTMQEVIEIQKNKFKRQQIKRKKKVRKVFMIKKKVNEQADVFDYKNIKDQEFKSFFLNGLDAKPLSSRFVIFINFYLVMRLMCYDLCYISLGFLPQTQILTMLALETVLMMMIFRAQIKYSLFKTKFTFLRLLSQSFAIWFWFLVSWSYSFEEVLFLPNGLRIKEVVQPFSSSFDFKIQWLAIFLIFLALLLEIINIIAALIIAIREWWALRKQAKLASKIEQENAGKNEEPEILQPFSSQNKFLN